ncbi:MAG: tryptophan-rich sensory protein [Clostridiales bacterium]|jgi:tryptophan-rich sensory protein|nr:tryptophan-rich sensory protein [Clostridiales bacterium]
MNEKIKKSGFPVAFAGIAAAILFAAAVLFVDSESDWYRGLMLPGFMPGGLALLIIWGVMLAAAGCAFCLILLKGCGDRYLYLMAGGLALGLILWPPLFYAVHSVTWSAVIIIAVLVLTSYIAVDLKKKSCKTAFLLFAAFDAWIAFLTVTNLVVMLMN